MDDEEIEQLIGDLRQLLFRKGFAWAAIEAEDSLNSMVAPRTRALVLIAAAQSVTVDLANTELAANDAFGGGGIRFEPDDTERPDGEEPLGLRDREALDVGRLPPSGPQRREVLLELAAHREVFAALRSHLDGLV
ncbi:hypothetical protein [Celeribacter halophilus]|uniref:hypothetical protein n=1 Tax=Celeribacter halophilus TaxID=576117 RepID=UPI003A8DC3DF